MSDELAAEKASFQYCAKCKDFVETIHFEQMRNKNSRSAICNKHPDETPEVTRFCCECKDHLPVADFPKGQRRFLCKKHFAMKNAAKVRQNEENIPCKARSEKVWKICYRDSQNVTNAKMTLTKKQILHLLLEIDPLSQHDYVCLPKNPFIVTSKDNVVVLAKSHRETLLNLISEGNMQAYAILVQTLAKNSFSPPQP